MLQVLQAKHRSEELEPVVERLQADLLKNKKERLQSEKPALLSQEEVHKAGSRYHQVGARRMDELVPSVKCRVLLAPEHASQASLVSSYSMEIRGLHVRDHDYSAIRFSMVPNFDSTTLQTTR